MARNSKIEWCNATNNPVVGCSQISEGCKNCYAKGTIERFPWLSGTRTFGWSPDSADSEEGIGWDSRAHFLENRLSEPLKWKKPLLIFSCCMGDLFHESIKDEQIDQVLGVMWASLYQYRNGNEFQWHTYVILTKRVDRMRDYFGQDRREEWSSCAARMIQGCRSDDVFDQTANYNGPHPRLWLGISAENQYEYNNRISQLCSIDATKKVISVEPQLEEIDLMLRDVCDIGEVNNKNDFYGYDVDWVICGPENGPNKRPFDVNWARSLRDQCKEAGVSFFLKDGVGDGEDGWLDGEYCRSWPDGRKWR